MLPRDSVVCDSVEEPCICIDLGGAEGPCLRCEEWDCVCSNVLPRRVYPGSDEVGGES